MTFQLYLGDLHVHSRRSDGELKPEKIFESAAEHYLDYVALADHDTHPYVGAFNNVVSVPAIEFSLGHKWHMVALGMSIPTPIPDAAKMIGWARSLHDQGGALILAHPWTITSRPSALRRIEEWLGEGALDGIELLNTAVTPQQRDDWLRMFQYYLSVWEPYHPSVIGGSDYHHSRHGKRLGLGCTYIFAEDPSAEELIRAVRHRRTVAAVPEGKEFWSEWIPWLHSAIPDGEMGIGPPDVLEQLGNYRRLAEENSSPGAARALEVGNYRRVIEIGEEEQSI